MAGRVFADGWTGAMTRGLGIGGRFPGVASAGTGKAGTGATILTGTSMATRWKADAGRSSAADGATIGDAAGGTAIMGVIAAEDGAMVTTTDTVTATIMDMTTKEEQTATEKAPGAGPFLLAWKRCGR